MQKTAFILVLVGLVFFVSADRGRDEEDSDDHHGSSGSSSPHTQSLWLELSSCTLNYIQGPGSSISFKNCSFNSTSSNGWSLCFSKCCEKQSSGSYSTPSQQAIDYCSQLNELSDYPVLKIVLSIIGALLGIAIVVCLCFFCRKVKKMRRRSQANVDQNSRENIYVKPENPEYVPWRQEKQVNSKKGKSLVWSSRAKEEEPIETAGQSCAICLEGSTSAELECGHQYHPRCIGDWLKKSKDCPCCRRKNTGRVKIYCEKCRWNYYVCTRDLMSSSNGILPLRCENCSKSGNLKGGALKMQLLHVRRGTTRQHIMN